MGRTVFTNDGFPMTYLDANKIGNINDIFEKEEKENFEMRRFGKKCAGLGWYAYINDDKQLVIGEECGRDGGDLYVGEWKGMDTPYLLDIMKEDSVLFNEILEFFRMDFATVYDYACNKLLEGVEKHLPKALYDKTKADYLEKYHSNSKRNHIFSTMDVLKQEWEDGCEVVYVPAYFERRKKK